MIKYYIIDFIMYILYIYIPIITRIKKNSEGDLSKKFIFVSLILN